MKREVNSEICSNYYCYYYYSSVIQVRISSDLPYFVKRGKVLQDSNLAEYRRSRQKEQILGFVQIQLAQPASTFPPYQTHFLL